jgi:PKHD-type hydroxylase
MLFEIPPKNTFNKQDYAYWENFLTEEEINFILARPEWLTASHGVVTGDQTNGSIIPEIRRSQVGWLHVNSETLFLWERITNIISEVNSRFFHYSLTGCYEPLQLGMYNANDTGHYTWHRDSSDRVEIPRKLSMSLLLSDPKDFEGGEFQIKVADDNPITLEQKKGRAWFFPSHTLHRVAPITKGMRRSLVLWIGGPEFK